MNHAFPVELAPFRSSLTTNPRFTFDAALRTLNVTWSNPLPPGEYSFSFNTSGFTDAAGSKLSPGWSGAAIKLRDNSAGSPLKANGIDIVAFEDHPSLVDLEGDGKNDLIVRERIAAGQSKVRFYRNSGTATNPVFDNPVIKTTLTRGIILANMQVAFRGLRPSEPADVDSHMSEIDLPD